MVYRYQVFPPEFVAKDPPGWRVSLFLCISSLKVETQELYGCRVTCFFSGDKGRRGRPAIRFHHQVSLCGSHGLQIPPLAGMRRVKRTPIIYSAGLVG